MTQLSFHKFFPSESFPALTVTSAPQQSFTYFGIDTSFDKSLAIIFLQAHVVGNVAELFEAFLSNFREHHMAPEHTAFWLKICIWLDPTYQHDVPRWHQDGTYWTTGPEEMPYKVGTVFKGASTLFLEPKVEYVLTMKESVERLYQDKYSSEEEAIERLWLAEKFKEAAIFQGKPGELGRWVVGNDEFAVIHSEPPIHGPRIFLSFLPGTDEQIRELCRNWNQVFVDGKDSSKDKPD